MTEQQFFDDLMLDLRDDSLALWDVEALARKELAHLPEAQRSQRARALVNDYLSRGWIDIFEQQVTYLPGNNAEFGPPIPVEPARIAGILQTTVCGTTTRPATRQAGSSFG